MWGQDSTEPCVRSSMRKRTRLYSAMGCPSDPDTRVVGSLVGYVACPPVRWAVHPAAHDVAAWLRRRRAAEVCQRERATRSGVCTPFIRQNLHNSLCFKALPSFAILLYYCYEVNVT